MEEFALVEADFQQYYQINLDIQYSNMVKTGTGFLRYARLFGCLPSDSRIMKKIDPVGSWSWDNEVYSRILYELSRINANMYNMTREKGTAAEDPGEQFEPDYVKEAKNEYRQWLEDQKEQDIADMRAFWQTRNPNVKLQ